MSDTYDVFISHRSDHKPWVITLANNLRQRGYRVFLDAWELVPGQNLIPGLSAALQNSRKGILVATPDTVHSGWVKEEYEAMLIRKQQDPDFTIVPIVFGDIPDLPFLGNVLCVDFRDPAPAAYRQAFYLLGCGLDGKRPGAVPELDDDLEIPEPSSKATPSMPESEQGFLNQVFATIHAAPPLMLLAQADRGQGDMIQAILQRARDSFTPEYVLHVTPPYSREAELGDYFAHLARQCQFPDSVLGSIQWESALGERLEKGERLFMLVSGFENGSETGRRELAGVLRSLNERHANRLQIVLCGGERLAELKYGPAHLSLLSSADVLEWPELSAADVIAWQQRDFPDVELHDEEAQVMLTLCGGHPRLLRHCFQHRLQDFRLDAAGYRRLLQNDAFFSQLFTPYRENSYYRQQLCGWLAHEALEPYQDWPSDALLRRLYWNNLLANRDRRFVWRCDLLRDAGREILACDT